MRHWSSATRVRSAVCNAGSSSHSALAGAGSIFEALRARKPLLVVVNSALMDNHQAELAVALAEKGHLAQCAPEALLDALTALRPQQMVPYECGSAVPVAQAIDALCGFTAS